MTTAAERHRDEMMPHVLRIEKSIRELTRVLAALQGRYGCTAVAVFIVAAASARAQAIDAGTLVRVWAPSVFLDRFEGIYAGRILDTVVVRDAETTHRVPVAAITALQVGLSNARAGAKKGARLGGGIAAAIGLAYASDGLSGCCGLSVATSRSTVS